MAASVSYDDFLDAKKIIPHVSGFKAESLNPNLFDFQKVIVEWALRRGRSAIFADTGLGKTLMQTSWADAVCKHTGGDVLIFAPLCVAHQTVEESAKFGIEVNYCRKQDDIKSGINITNYEMLEHFDIESFIGIVLDESSIIKNRDGKTRNALIDSCRNVKYRLSCTATPSPNDFMEIGNQAEWLGIVTITEMLAMFFINDAGDTGTWILKGHGKVKFWEWLATWAIVIKSPADLGFDGSSYLLPELIIESHIVESETTDGLFADIAVGLMDRNKARKESIDDRVAKAASVALKFFDVKLAEYESSIGDNNGMEKGICGKQTIESKIGCGIQEKEKRAIDNRYECEKGLHEEIQTGKSGEMEEVTGKTKGSQRKEEKEICIGSTIQGGSEEEIEGLAISESGKEKESAPIEIWNNEQKSIGNDGNTGECLQDMRVLEYGECEDVSYGGSLPFDWNREGYTLLELQHGAREIQRRYRAIKESNTLFRLPSFVFWCNRNEEQDKLEDIFKDLCLSVYGTLSSDEKEKRIKGWEAHISPILLSKVSVCGYGMNWQHCNNTAFVGLSDSWEMYYQAIRRFYRFGQKESVNVHVISAESEGAVVENIRRKDIQNQIMSAEMVKHMATYTKNEVFGIAEQKDDYARRVLEKDRYTLHNADCIELAKEIESDSVGFTIYSPPFSSLFTYSNSDRDMGNNKSYEDFSQHFSYLVDEMYRITMPGRLMAVHCMQLTTSKTNDGFIGIKDFRGDLIRMFQSKGWIYHSEVCIWKDPVVAMQRTKALGLLHKTIKKDSSMSRQGLADYLIVMRKPGVNVVPISHTPEQFPVEMWQRYASPVWFDINQTRTLNYREARDEDDVKHICPLQLDVIERALELWSAPDDLVFSPFLGVGSEGYCAVKMGRRFIGSELKPSYFDQAVKNMEDATRYNEDLFS